MQPGKEPCNYSGSGRGTASLGCCLHCVFTHILGGRLQSLILLHLTCQLGRYTIYNNFERLLLMKRHKLRTVSKLKVWEAERHDRKTDGQGCGSSDKISLFKKYSFWGFFIFFVLSDEVFRWYMWVKSRAWYLHEDRRKKSVSGLTLYCKVRQAEPGQARPPD